MSDLPLVSIVIPTYNGEHYVAAALASARAQTYPNIEILVSDDGSHDATADILRAMAADDPRVRVIAHPQNIGPVANQIGLHEEARGAFIKPLLQDDLLAPDAVSRLVPPLAADPGIVLAFARRQLIDEYGDVLPHPPWTRALTEADAVLDGWELGSAMLEQTANLVGEVTCGLYRKDAVGDISQLWSLDGYTFGPVADVALWLKLLGRGRAFYTPEILSSFRQHGAQSTHRPEVALGGTREWCLLVMSGRRLGHLSSPRRERQALTAALAMAANGLRQAAHDPDWSARLRAVMQETLGRLADPELQPLAQHYPVAVAAPAVDPAEIRASVRRLRSLAQDAQVGRCVIAIPADAVETAVPHVERALALGPDFDLELTPTDTPGAVVAGPWLAVVTGEDAWAVDASERVDAA